MHNSLRYRVVTLVACALALAGMNGCKKDDSSSSDEPAPSDASGGVVSAGGGGTATGGDTTASGELGTFTITAPSAATNVAAPTAQWGASANAAVYDVGVSTANDCSGSQQVHLAVTDTAQALTTLPDGAYYLCVTARSASGATRASANSPLAFAVKTAPPGAFQITSPKAIAGATPKLTWSASDTAVSYQVAVATDAGCTSTLHTADTTALLAQTSLTLPNNSLVYVCARAIDVAGNVVTATNSPMPLNIGGVVLGAPSPTVSDRLVNGFDRPSGVTFDGTHVIVVDSEANRVLIWNSVPGNGDTPPDVILGQPNLSSSVQDYGGNGAPSARGFNHPKRATSDGTRLVVSDSYNDRVLIWTTFPTANNQPADLVLGKTSMTDTLNNTTSAATLRYPEGLAIIGTGNTAKLAVTDPLYNRVLLWTTFPTSNGQAADVVIGQPNATATGDGCTAARLSQPVDVASNGVKLFIADRSNHRVVGFNTIPTSHGAAASLVLGQPDATTCTTPASPPSATKLLAPVGVAHANGQLLIADAGYNRVLVYASTPTTTNAAATSVIGQTTMATAGSGVATQSNLSAPSAVTLSGSYMLIADAYHHRVLAYNGVPSTDGASPSVFMGQADGTTDRQNPALTGALTPTPNDVATDGTHVAVADTVRHRVLLWNARPTASGTPADVALGQTSLTSSAFVTTSATSLSSPGGMAFCGGKLVVVDMYQHRVLVWNTVPTANGAPASFALGQPDLVSGNGNRGGAASASTLYYPSTVACTGAKLIVADRGNNRVLIWSTFPTADGEAASVVVGQPDMTSTVADNVPSATGFMSLLDVATDGTKLFVSDAGRVLVYDAIPTANGAVAPQVLGTPDLTSYAYGTSQFALGGSTKVASFGGALYALDVPSHRVLRWSPVPTASGAEADGLFGQPDYTHSGTGGGVPLSDAGFHLTASAGIAVDDTWIYVTDPFNQRVVMVPTHRE